VLICFAIKILPFKEVSVIAISFEFNESKTTVTCIIVESNLPLAKYDAAKVTRRSK
jgi:hypothetical protein